MVGIIKLYINVIFKWISYYKIVKLKLEDFKHEKKTQEGKGREKKNK